MKKFIAFLLVICTISAMAIPAFAANLPFTDVDCNAWYCSKVKYCYEHNLMNGVSETEFNPQGIMTRAEAAQVIYELAKSRNLDKNVNWDKFGYESGSQNSNSSNGNSSDSYGYSCYSSGFDDVKGYKWDNNTHSFKKVWYHEAVTWCHITGVISGYNDGNFGPTDKVTREQIVTMLYALQRYIDKGSTTSHSLNDPSYKDKQDISSWARNAVSWAVYHNLLTGVNENDGKHLNPKNNCTRAELATLLAQYDTHNCS